MLCRFIYSVAHVKRSSTFCKNTPNNALFVPLSRHKHDYWYGVHLRSSYWQMGVQCLIFIWFRSWWDGRGANKCNRSKKKRETLELSAGSVIASQCTVENHYENVQTYGNTPKTIVEGHYLLYLIKPQPNIQCAKQELRELLLWLC